MKDERPFADEITIVVTAFNRPNSLERVLNSLVKANYLKERVRLVISIDYSGCNEVVDIAENFKWIYGEKVIISHKENLGLRKHILYCGDLTQKYGNIILLEDDIYVAPDFLNYAMQAMLYYKNDENIAGISLYSQNFNETAGLPFEPIQDSNGADAYFMQLPSSWGQLWTPYQWEQFINWYNNNSYNNEAEIPKNVVKWPETSWKKYFIRYMVEKNKYFVYPYRSLSTNFGDIGQHFWKKNTTFQVTLSRDTEKIYTFCKFEESEAVYDVFCENMYLKKYIDGIGNSELTIDLYGTKEKYSRYILTTKKLNYVELESYDLSFRPIELNVIENLKGYNIFLYDTTQKNKKVSNGNHVINLIDYFYLGINIQKTLLFSFNKQIILQNIRGIMKKINKKILKK
ncbi:TPA: glycosyltransferase [Bacillus mycoides]|uniref:glycosyltransferase n=1 Tax=Bacillus sp. FSL P2-0099 TaxID=2921572 RepID=UPI0030FCAA32|nr:glycosyltransferase [Bacillus mycoides]